MSFYTDLDSLLPTPATGDTVPATWFDAVRDNFEGLYDAPYTARAYRNAALNIAAAASTTLIACDTELWDPNGNFNTGTGRYTCPVDGLYLAMGAFSFNIANNPEEVEAQIHRNASLHTAGDRNTWRNMTGGDDVALSVTALVVASASDVLDLRAQHLQGGNACGLNVGSSARCWFGVVKIG